MSKSDPVGEAVSFPQTNRTDATNGKLTASPTKEAKQWIELCPGIRRRTVAHGTTMYQMMAQLDAGATMPEHTHPQEQIMHLLKGAARVVVDGKEQEMRPGDSVYVPANVPHGVRAVHEQTFILDTFSPPRDDYVARDRQG